MSAQLKHSANGNEPLSDEAYRQIQQEHGAPVFWDKWAERIVRINEPFWAAVFARKNVIIHEYLEEVFYLYNHGSGLYVPESNDEVQTKLAATLLQASRQRTSLKGIEKFQAAQSLHGVIEHLRCSGSIRPNGFYCWMAKPEPGKRRSRLCSKKLWAPKTSRGSARNILKSDSRLEGFWTKRCFWALT